MNFNIVTQMTVEEMDAYARTMIERAGADLTPVQRVAIVTEVIRVCGRPIAKAEQEMIATVKAQMEKEMLGQRHEGPRIFDGPFRGGGAVGPS